MAASWPWPRWRRPAVGGAAYFLQVVPGAEGAALSAQHDDMNRHVGRECIEFVLQGIYHPLRQGVARVRMVQGKGGNAMRIVAQNERALRVFMWTHHNSRFVDRLAACAMTASGGFGRAAASGTFGGRQKRDAPP